jgi:hypothetical protein
MFHLLLESVLLEFDHYLAIYTFYSLPNPSGPTRPWGLLSLYQKLVPETLK